MVILRHAAAGDGARVKAIAILIADDARYLCMTARMAINAMIARLLQEKVDEIKQKGFCTDVLRDEKG